MNNGAPRAMERNLTMPAHKKPIYKKFYETFYRLESFKNDMLDEMFDITGLFTSEDDKKMYHEIVKYKPGYIRNKTQQRQFSDARKILMIARRINRAYEKLLEKHEEQTHKIISDTVKNCAKISWRNGTKTICLNMDNMPTLKNLKNNAQSASNPKNNARTRNA